MCIIWYFGIIFRMPFTLAFYYIYLTSLSQSVLSDDDFTMPKPNRIFTKFGRTTKIEPKQVSLQNKIYVLILLASVH